MDIVFGAQYVLMGQVKQGSFIGEDVDFRRGDWNEVRQRFIVSFFYYDIYSFRCKSVLLIRYWFFGWVMFCGINQMGGVF